MSGVAGIFGGTLAYFIINYSRLEAVPNLRYMFGFQLVFVIILGKNKS